MDDNELKIENKIHIYFFYFFPQNESFLKSLQLSRLMYFCRKIHKKRRNRRPKDDSYESCVLVGWLDDDFYSKNLFLTSKKQEK